MKSIKKLFVLLIVSVFLISMVAATASAASVSKNEKKDTGIVVESKSKTVSYKVTWNANNGKIGDKAKVKTTVKKGYKVKMPTNPKRSTYVFLGWYTKKSGGKKITANTKPTKNVAYYAHWRLKIAGTWKDNSNTFVFNTNGKFKYTQRTSTNSIVTEGRYKVTAKKISFTKIVSNPGKSSEKARKDTVFEYKFVKENGREYLLIPTVFNDQPYVDINYGVGLNKA
ncbi:MAG: InlB B-repeat-containing protein [Methanobrevibacter sp.]|nr:InlB B-repeat-containing protein [Methanobrevibacter sp.]